VNLGALQIGAGIKTAFGALGLAIMAGLFAYYRHLRNQEVKLKEIPRGERAKISDNFLTRYKVDGSDLTSDQRYDLIRFELEKRASRLTLPTIVIAAVFLVCFTVASIVQRSSALRNNENTTKPISIDAHLSSVAAEIGLNAIEHGKYKTEENDRLIASIKKARTIKILVVNGDNIFQTFKEEFREFLSKPQSSIQILVATANSNFYREETEMTKLDATPKDLAYIANQGKVEFNRKRLVDSALDPSQVQFKYFDTQYRLPIIIIDDKTCYLTLRLSPNESQQSVRLEFEGGPQGFADSCVAHFNRMWVVSSLNPKK
jgi:predicted nucleic acid-binding protein